MFIYKLVVNKNVDDNNVMWNWFEYWKVKRDTTYQVFFHLIPLLEEGDCTGKVLREYYSLLWHL